MVEIRKIQRSEYKKAMDIAWKTFLEFEGEVYTREGVKSFYDFISDPLLERMFLLGEYLIFGAFWDDKMVGIAGIRNKNHLSLLFVDKEYHNMGVGSALVFSAFRYSMENYKEKQFTVNASPYALGFYHRLGFQDTSQQVVRDGVIYTPMCCRIVG